MLNIGRVSVLACCSVLRAPCSEWHDSQIRCYETAAAWLAPQLYSRGTMAPARLDGMTDHVRWTMAIPAGRHGTRVPLGHCRPTLAGPVPG